MIAGSWSVLAIGAGTVSTGLAFLLDRFFLAVSEYPASLNTFFKASMLARVSRAHLTTSTALSALALRSASIARFSAPARWL